MKVSVVTPSYNQGRFIERTLRSVADQRGAEIEHVVFDGGSSDETVEVLRTFKPPVRWVSEKDRGQTHAVNKGIRATSGEIIGWLNSDDVYYPGAVARVLDYFDAHPEVDVVYGKADHIDVDDHAFEAYPTEPFSLDRLRDTCFICQPALFMRRRVVEQHGLLEESLRYCMDYEFWLRLAKAGVRFGYLEEKLAGSRLYAETKTMGARIKVHQEIIRMLKMSLGTVPDQWLFNYAHVVVETKVDRTQQPKWFVYQIGMRSILAALRWNKALTGSMVERVLLWMKHA